MAQPIVSIITPFKNAETFIPGFIENLQQQTLHNWTAILVDDHSSDNGFRLLQQLTSADHRFLIITNPHRSLIPGPASARNLALDLVQTPLIAFCDIDDLWHPDKLRIQTQYHLSNHLDISVSHYCRFSTPIRYEQEHCVIRPPRISSLKKLLVRNYIPMLTVIASSRLLKGHYFLEINHEDFYYWISLYTKVPTLKYACIEQVLAFYRVHDQNISGNKIMMPLWTYQVYRRLAYGRLHSLFLLALWLNSHLYSLVLRRCHQNRYVYSRSELL